MLCHFWARAAEGGVFFADITSETNQSFVSWCFNEVIILMRFFGRDFSTMTLVMRQVDLPVATEKVGELFVVMLFQVVS